MAHDDHGAKEPTPRASRRARRPAASEGEPVGRHRAAGPARDPVDLRRLGRASSRCCSATTSASRSSCCPSTTCWRKLKEDWHGVGALHAARPDEPAVLARACRHRGRRLPVPHQSRAAGAPRARPRAASTRCSTTTTTSTASTSAFFAARRAQGRRRSCRTSVTARSSRVVVNGSGAAWWAGGAALLRQIQSGYVYHYAFTMIIGLFALLTWWVMR